MPADSRSYVAGNFFLTLDGVKCGFVKSVDGGAVSAEVIKEHVGPRGFVNKHIGQPKYEEFAIAIGFSMAKAVYGWIADSWAMNYRRKSGAIVAADYQSEAKRQWEFLNALITETTIPACDGASREPAHLTVKFAPEYIKQKSASGKVADAGKKGQQKMWLPSNFRLEIAGLDCSKVSKIDAFTVKQAIATDDIGGERGVAKEPGGVEFPNLRITLSEAGAQSWMDWCEDFVIKGRNDESREKSGTLTLLAPDARTELARVTFRSVGIFKLAREKVEANADQIQRLVADLYCERMEFVCPVHEGGGQSAPEAAARSPSAARARRAGARRARRR
ncbi:MAG: phage tail protein [Armatimonadetes bacterium]|nr:phage tail protein [Armatimonadota bacterium]